MALEHPDIVRRMARELQAWKVKAAAARLKSDAETSKGMTPEDLERLRSLGYIR